MNLSDLTEDEVRSVFVGPVGDRISGVRFHPACVEFLFESGAVLSLYDSSEDHERSWDFEPSFVADEPVDEADRIARQDRSFGSRRAAHSPADSHSATRAT